ncbi:hypothetical protein PHPALM_27885 [Phytophthora palmivora]|uniref:Integrase catalytic domain-containing protein n=1 Tax=Phytophthora palmivora TaxID=4796 RepID=A0A2P4XBJ7_9STRA|nr:hypothetical protein PHPALM_27885 [Phytophthora palmivora]
MFNGCGTTIPRSFSETRYTFERNETLHWDFLTDYFLVVKDEATHVVDLVACESPASEVDASAILDWYSRFGAPSISVSDSGTDFKNKVVVKLSRRLKGHQDFVLAYSPWKNGSVELVNRDILQMSKPQVLEFKVSTHDLPYLLPLVQPFSGAIISKPYPIELFTRLPCPNMMDTIIFPGKKSRVVILTQLRPNIEKYLDKLRKDIRSMHKAAEAELKLQVQRYRERPHYEQNVNFSIALRTVFPVAPFAIEWLPYNEYQKGDLVYQVATVKRRMRTLADYNFTVKHLVNGGEIDVHLAHLKFYSEHSQC